MHSGHSGRLVAGSGTADQCATTSQAQAVAEEVLFAIRTEASVLRMLE